MNTTTPTPAAPVLASAASAIARRGLFGEQPLVVGSESQEWALWLTAIGQVVPMPGLGEALIEAAEHNAVAADMDDGSPFNAVVHAVVLHHGKAWRRPRQARTGSVRPHVVHSAWCAICDEPLDDEYGYYESPADVVAAARDRGWKTLTGGELVCPEPDPAHLAAKNPPTGPAAPGQDTLVPAPDPASAQGGASDSRPDDSDIEAGRYLYGARINRAPAQAALEPAQPAGDIGTGHLTRASERTNRLTAEDLRVVLQDAPGHAVVEMAGYPLTRAEYTDGVVDLHA
ncbi:hypothetical protein [Kitasatospora griseola]|uniref:hypothetical protein n=1 Tax=Kitasatospora griseola TaxID=2064 RepID=UPI0016710B0D|nr:hypothetical protein [Kitasatospora griseola]GGR04397.1 hypothetical protein GCM10010195_69850 [Kitasatospora griseola]